MEKILIVDGNSLINRAFYATTLENGATYGFLNMFLRAVQTTGATGAAIAFDVREKTFRHKLYDGYKGTRKGMPDELAKQLGDLKTVLKIMGVKMFEKAGFEADDIIGTISKMATGAHNVIILTADRDCLQLVGQDVEVHLTKVGVTNIEIYDIARIRNEFEIDPHQLVDVKALMGDKSDNIPGAKNVGEKTALKYIRTYGNVQSLLEKCDDEKIAPYKDVIAQSRVLAEIKCDVDIAVDFGALKFSLPMSRAVFEAFRERKFFSLLKRDELWNAPSDKPIVEQVSFF